MLENRQAMKRDLPAASSSATACARIDHYPQELLRPCARSRRRGRGEPTVVLLTPGIHNSAYFEHSFLARQMGIELVEGRDLVVHDDSRLHAHDPRTPARRRDLPPRRRRLPRPARLPARLACSASPGLFNAYRAGNVALANALGTGVADDKAIYAYVPEMIRYYLGEEPLLAQRADLPRLPTTTTGATSSSTWTSSSSSRSTRAAATGCSSGRRRPRPSARHSARRSRPSRASYVAQPTIALSRHPTFVDGSSRPAHVDLRPFILYGERITRRPRRAHARGDAAGLARRQLLAGRRQQGHLGAARLMLSRVAESLYWMARYLERAEVGEQAAARQLPRAPRRARRRPGRRPGASCSRDRPATTLFREHFDEFTAAAVSEFLLLHPANPNAVVACVERARENARSVREQISSEMWEHAEPAAPLRARGPDAVLQRAARLLRPHPRRVARVPGGDEGDAHPRRGLRVPRARRAPRARRPHGAGPRVEYRRMAGRDLAMRRRLTALLKILRRLSRRSAARSRRLRSAASGSSRSSCSTAASRGRCSSALERLPRAAVGAISGDAPQPQRSLGRLVSELVFCDPRDSSYRALARRSTRCCRDRHGRMEIAATYFNTTRVVVPAPRPRSSSSEQCPVLLQRRAHDELHLRRPALRGVHGAAPEAALSGGQRCSSFRLSTEPRGVQRRAHHDHYGNEVLRFDVLEPHERLS